jgi:hypothetical protein
MQYTLVRKHILNSMRITILALPKWNNTGKEHRPFEFTGIRKTYRPIFWVT